MTVSTPTARQLRAEDLAQGNRAAVEALNNFILDVCTSLRELATQSRVKTGLRFVTTAGGAGTLDVANTLPGPCRFAFVGELRREDGVALSSAYGLTHTNLPQSNTVRLSFVGLAASEAYLCNVALE